MTGAQAHETLTDEQLRTVAAYLARVCLEIERGLRSPVQLQPFTHPRRPSQWERHITIGRFRGGPVRREDIGPAMLSRLTNEHAIATVVTRTEGHRWGAITLDLQQHDGRWYIADLQRILASTHYRTRPTVALPHPDHQSRRTR